MQLSENEITDAIAFFASHGFVADYNDQMQTIIGGTERFTFESGVTEGYVNPFRIHLIADKWMVRLKLGQIPFDVSQPNLQAASQVVVNLYKPSVPFEDGSITVGEAVAKLLEAGFDAIYTPSNLRFHPNSGSIRICYQEYCSSGITITRKGSYYFAAEILKNPFSQKLLLMGVTLLEVIAFLCSSSY